MDDLAQNLADWLPELVAAAQQTLWLTLASFSVAAVLGTLVCACFRSRSLSLRIGAQVYSEIARGLPILVVLFMLYFGLPVLLPELRWSTSVCAILGFGLQGAAILAETYRAALDGVSTGEREAAKAIGLTPLQAMTHVIVPQAYRIALPGAGNYLIGLLKDTSIASVIAAPELMLRGKDLASASFMPMPVYLLVAAAYLLLSLPLAAVVSHLERRSSHRRRLAA